MTVGGNPLRSATCYSRLAHDPGHKLAEFRVATLLPGDWSDGIQCQLTVHSLHDPPHYETISYAWGDPQDTKQITVDGAELVVPSSLESCLRHIRDSKNRLVLWTDAICIDQSNLQERALQVSNMGYIYWKCSSMYIWLGMPAPSHETEDPFEMVMHWAKDKHFYQYPGFAVSEQTGTWVFHDNPTYQHMFELFADFISRPWWSRLWCVQEIALCPTATVVLGNYRIPWTGTLNAQKNYYRHASDCCAQASTVMPERYTYFSDHLLFLSQQTDLTNVDYVLRGFRHKLCKDPRDKIYGLLGLLWKNPNIKLRPDYTLPVGRVYCQATRAIILQAEGDLHFLTGLGVGSECYSLPSWTRNFAMPLTNVEASYEQSRYNYYRLYDAGGETKSDLEVLDDDTLCLKGILVDRVKHIGVPIQDRNYGHIWEVIQDWVRIAGLSSLEHNQDDGPSQERFWRTIIADIMPKHVGSAKIWNRLAVPTDVPTSTLFADMMDCLRRGAEPPATPVVGAFSAATYSRAFCRTENGHFGLCFPHTRPGDEVWMLAGGKVPFVLRPLNDAARTIKGPGTRTRHFALVGECYLHGFMDGEALRKGANILLPIHLT